MTVAEKLGGLAQRAPDLVPHLDTEEATKNALVMPFIAALGYDVFNPLEVVPEFTADVGTKKGEKVDYAISRDGRVMILVECKKASVDLSETEMSQLYRYFSVTEARIGILTNGLQYRFYSDLEAPNKMDRRPFLVLDLLDLRDDAAEELQALTKDGFDLDQVLTAASELKTLRELKQLILQQMDEPDEDFVRFLFGKTNPGERFVASVRDTFASTVAAAFQQVVTDRVSQRLRSALRETAGDGSDIDASDDDEQVETTVEELEGFHIVKAIVREVLSPARVVYRDTKSYMGVLVDDNNRKPICRFHFNRKQKYIGLFDDQKKETRVPIESLNEIYQQADALKAAAGLYKDVS